ncbi:iron chelate uptake ABC transporter family permease subunit [Hyphomicrobium sp. D-2]|uniref:iron chelate uptake ABC transporter family permease subunit n=1 Tax=Hyphomicrobium sp. D-2 TaxID=3041621 RepID=UPI002454BEDE|nr:iron chelate uptake ABC transporter family permease subunit [Hyphomicrobium sp. D-2]MDH4982148.1 iron chelate uptake ABC transporter family permease subunit [Hyphomicrobium sp. D-2]
MKQSASTLLSPSVLPVAVLALLCVIACVAFMTVGANGAWSFVLPFRGGKLAAMVLVGYSIAVSTVLFQTVTGNRILTPAIMGLDTLYVLIQTALIFSIGSAATAALPPAAMFLAQATAMILFSGLLYLWLFSGRTQSLYLIVLVGLVLGVLFRSVANLLQRLMSPNEFVVLADRLFANFNTVNTQVLAVAAVAVVAVSIFGFRKLRTLDVLLLGREPAIALGVDYKASVAQILIIVAILVSVSTALVGPVTFFGLLVASLAYRISSSQKHVYVLPVAVLVAILMLVGGQFILERVFAFNTALSIIIEFAGGIAFIIMLLRGTSR